MPISVDMAHMGLSENVVYPIVPNGFADHSPYEKWLAIIGNINPTFSDKAIFPNISNIMGYVQQISSL